MDYKNLADHIGATEDEVRQYSMKQRRLAELQEKRLQLVLKRPQPSARETFLLKKLTIERCSRYQMIRSVQENNAQSDTTYHFAESERSMKESTPELEEWYQLQTSSDQKVSDFKKKFQFDALGQEIEELEKYFEKPENHYIASKFQEMSDQNKEVSSVDVGAIFGLVFCLGLIVIAMGVALNS